MAIEEFSPPLAAAPVASPFAAPAAVVAPVFLLAYLGLDWITFVPDIARLGITPWAPSIGLGVALIALRGVTHAPLVAAAALLTDLLGRRLPFPWWVSAIEATLVGTIYALAIVLLLRPSVRFDRRLSTVRDIFLLIGTSIPAAAAVAFAYSGVLLAFGFLPASELAGAVLRHGTGDIIGIMVMAPFVLLAVAGRTPRIGSPVQAMLQLLAVVAAVLIVFGHLSNQQHLFYLLLLPIVWIAVTRGLEGVAAGLVVMQIGIMVVLHYGNADASIVTAYQAIMIVLIFSGLTIGVLMSERARAEQRLRQQQEAIARATRLGTAGELATALAHELNQPLTAVGNYSQAVVASLRQPKPDIETAMATARRAVEQTERAAQVVRRLRDFISIGRLHTAPNEVTHLVDESIELVRLQLSATGTEVEVEVPSRLPRVEIDLIQIEQVLTNLLRNAIEAMVECGTEHRRITITCRQTRDGQIGLEVCDNGPGFEDGFDLAATSPVESRKPGGLGIGLALCQSIIRAHGGSLEIGAAVGGGARVNFTLPTAKDRTL